MIFKKCTSGIRLLREKKILIQRNLIIYHENSHWFASMFLIMFISCVSYIIISLTLIVK